MTRVQNLLLSAFILASIVAGDQGEKAAARQFSETDEDKLALFGQDTLEISPSLTIVFQKSDTVWQQFFEARTSSYADPRTGDMLYNADVKMTYNSRIKVIYADTDHEVVGFGVHGAKVIESRIPITMEIGRN